MNFEYYEAPDGWRWRLRSANGEIVASGEAYATVESCLEVFGILGRAFSDGDVEVVQVQDKAMFDR